MKNPRRPIFLLICLILPFIVYANLIWPSIYIVQMYYTWYVIGIGLLIEFFAAKYYLKYSWKKTAGMVVLMNAISAILGLILIPLTGILCEILLLPFKTGTFDLLHWILDFVFAVFANACVENLSLTLIFKTSFKSNFWWILGANAVSVAVCAVAPMLL